MSNSIWKMPDQKPDIDKQILVINDFGYVIYFGKCAVAPENKWCYVDEIIAQADKAERLQKAVDVIANMEQRLCIDDPVDILDDVLKIAKDEIKQLIKENQ